MICQECVAPRGIRTARLAYTLSFFAAVSFGRYSRGLYSSPHICYSAPNHMPYRLPVEGGAWDDRSQIAGVLSAINYTVFGSVFCI